MASTSDFKNGLVLQIEGQLWTIIEFQHVKPGKGPAFVRTKLKNVLSGKVVDKTFNAGVKVETATVDRRDMTYLYHDGSDYIFMDGDTYDQVSISESTVGDQSRFLLENMAVQVATHEDVPLFVELPVTVELVVKHTDPGLQGDRSTGGTKPATLETGAEINVPLFINTGDKLKVDSRDGNYLGRVNSRVSGTHKKLGARHKARKRAVDFLFEAEARDLDPVALASERSDLSVKDDAVAPVAAYTVTLVSGVAENLDRIDQVISSHLQDWTLERLPAVDRAILRIAVWELFHATDVPPVVAVDEAVELAKQLSTDDSPGFVNGILGQVVLVAPQVRSAAAATSQRAQESDSGTE